jgi:hypothetical protein
MEVLNLGGTCVPGHGRGVVCTGSDLVCSLKQKCLLAVTWEEMSASTQERPTRAFLVGSCLI